MSLLKRFKNLWKLSEFEPQFDFDSPNVSHPSCQVLTMLKKPLKMAEIIRKKEDPLKEFDD